MTKEVLTRAKLAEILAEKHGLTKKASKTIVDDVLGLFLKKCTLVRQFALLALVHLNR